MMKLEKKLDEYVETLEKNGYVVHLPHRDVDQTDDGIGLAICDAHVSAALESDELHVWWFPNSTGSHFDFGMFFLLRKIKEIKPNLKIKEIVRYKKDPHKSYGNVLSTISEPNEFMLEIEEKPYIFNPKTMGSGIFACIPQTGVCPVGCEDCFFQSGRSYLEPLKENLPNMPLVEFGWGLVRVNDGNDSNVDRELVIRNTNQYPNRFFNTSIPKDLGDFPAPVVLTLNPADKTDNKVVLLKEIPKNLMFVRVRINTWNLDLVDKAVKYYLKKEIPIILTFMAYYQLILPEEHKQNYTFRKRTTNSYWAITTKAWEKIMDRYKYNPWVHSCGKIEGEKGNTSCRHCGNCLREYFATLEKMKS